MSKHSGLDLIAVLIRDHREIGGMLGELEDIPQSAGQQRQHQASMLSRELVRHRESEAQCLYGAVRTFAPDGVRLVEQDRRAWSDAAAILDGLASADPRCRHREELIGRLASWIRRHVEWQERHVLAELSKHADRCELEWLGDRVHTVKAAHPECSVTPEHSGLADGTRSVP